MLPQIFPAPVRCEESAASKAVGATKETVKEGTQKVVNTLDRIAGTSASEIAKWKKTFESHAKAVEGSDETFLDEQAFVSAIAPPEDFKKIGRQQYGILFRIADTQKRNKVEWLEFVAFQKLLKKPDAEFDMAFRFFDLDGNGEVTFDEFKRVFSRELGPDAIPFDFDSPWVELYLGKHDGNHVLKYGEFTQLMKGLQGERLRQAFHYFDKERTGYISPESFQRIIFELARHKLSDSVLESLPGVCRASSGGKISYSEVIAFHNVIREMDMVEKVVREACARSADGKIDQGDFMDQASRSMRYMTFSPMEASIIFNYAGLGTETRLGLKDFARFLDPKWAPPVPRGPPEAQTGNFLHEFGKSVYYFGLGGVAGALGATTVYPIDLVKTRMQNQRSKVVGELLYKNSIDCVKKVYKNEGFSGFYRGLPPQLLGVAPEKAIKLTVNDLIRGYATDPDTGRITLPWELVAGGLAGGCQVVFTNPLEIVKIRLQMQGEAMKSGAAITPQGATHIVKQLGLLGLYRGAVACLCRDVPFSAIYFPAYAHLKKDVFHEGLDGKKLGYGESLAAAAIAGMPAAYLTTPADVVKTRLQTEAKKGETNYRGVMDAFRKIRSEEGFRALYKGGPARVLRSSPQFGVTLVAYENLKKFFPFPDPTASISSLLPQEEDMSRIRARNALKVLLDCHEDFSGVLRKP